MLHVFYASKQEKRGGERIMPITQGQRLIFALLTVIITVHAFVF